MKKNLFRYLGKFLTPVLLLVAGCLDLPSEFKAPIIPYEGITVPLINKEFTLLETVKRDTTLKWDQTGSKANQLYYVEKRTMDKITIADKLKIDANNTSTSKEIGPVKISDEQTSTTIGLNWAPGVIAGTNFPFPAISGTETVDLPSYAKFNSATFESGVIEIEVKNNFAVGSGVNLSLSNILIKNKGNGQTVASNDSTTTIAPQQTKIAIVTFDRTKQVSNALTFTATVAGTQSNGLIAIPAKTINVTQRLKGITIASASAIIPGQDPILKDGEVKFDNSDSIKVFYVDIKSGTIDVNVVNSIDLSAKMKLKLNEIYKSAGATLPFDTTITMARKGTTKVSINMANYRIKSTNITTNKISKITYSTQVSVDSSSGPTDFRTISKTDGVSTSVNVSKLLLKKLNGQPKPTVLDPVTDVVDLPVEDIESKLKFTKLAFDTSAQIKLYLNTAADIDVKIKGSISSPGATKSLNIDQTINKTTKYITLKPADFLSSFGGKIPAKLNVNITPTLNPNYAVQTVDASDIVEPSTEMIIPLKLSILGGTIKDTAKDIEAPEQDQRENAQNVKKVQLILDIENGLPATLNVALLILDKTGKTILTIPTAGSDSIKVAGAVVDASGKVTAPTVSVIKTVLTNTDIDKFFDLKTALVNIKFNTSLGSGTTTPTVQFRTDQKIKIKGYAKIDYTLDPDKLNK